VGERCRRKSACNRGSFVFINASTHTEKTKKNGASCCSLVQRNQCRAAYSQVSRDGTDPFGELCRRRRGAALVGASTCGGPRTAGELRSTRFGPGSNYDAVTRPSFAAADRDNTTSAVPPEDVRVQMHVLSLFEVDDSEVTHLRARRLVSADLERLASGISKRCAGRLLRRTGNARRVPTRQDLRGLAS
jgi:hypothetical protein